MTTHIELAVRMLNEAAEFFNSVAEQNPQLEEKMKHTATRYHLAAELLNKDPHGSISAQESKAESSSEQAT